LPEELAELGATVNAMLQRLDDAFQRLSAFSADIAHELRTPLSNLLTHTQVTLTRPRSLEEYREALHSNLEELQWMAQLVNDMLYLAKADHGLLMPSRQPLELATEVDALLEYHAPLAEDEVRLLREGTAHTEGDRHAAPGAVQPAGQRPALYPGRRRDPRDAGARAAHRGGQSGPAIAPALPRLFDRFYRADPARQEGSSEHAGLGLAITRRSCRRMGKHQGECAMAGRGL
jgi:two-component system heavy metal sensor histidine kinase CusS